MSQSRVAQFNIIRVCWVRISHSCKMECEICTSGSHMIWNTYQLHWSIWGLWLKTLIKHPGIESSFEKSLHVTFIPQKHVYNRPFRNNSTQIHGYSQLLRGPQVQVIKVIQYVWWDSLLLGPINTMKCAHTLAHVRAWWALLIRLNVLCLNFVL